MVRERAPGDPAKEPQARRVNVGVVWDNFDRRMKAKGEAAANDGASAAGGEGPDMFEAAGVAAE
jgi:ribonucleoside-diphosphate reductase beta chain